MKKFTNPIFPEDFRENAHNGEEQGAWCVRCLNMDEAFSNAFRPMPSDRGAAVPRCLHVASAAREPFLWTHCSCARFSEAGFSKAKAHRVELCVA